MNTINDTYINALLADAAYVNLKILGDQNKNIAERLTQPQADFITANFEVLNQELSPTGGFDAVVWRRKSDAKIFVSMRGTQQGQDFIDDGDLALSGLAYKQLVSMTNWWLRETTAAGTACKQIKLDLDNNFIEDTAGGMGTGNLTSINHIASVNGHSLGGYLATAFVRLFGNQWYVEHTTTFNSAGFNNLQPNQIQTGFAQIQNIIGAQLGRSLFNNESQQDNFFAQNGPNVTTNDWRYGFTQYGKRTDLYQEDLRGAGGFDPFSNHYMYKQTDLLALGSALEKLDPNLTFDKLNTIIKAGSNDMKASYEGVLDALRKMIQGTTYDGYATAIGDASGDATTRQSFHANLKTLTDSAAYMRLVGKLTIAPIYADIASQARSDFASMAALSDLSPVAVMAKDAAAQGLLTAHWQTSRATDYANWQATPSKPYQPCASVKSSRYGLQTRALQASNDTAWRIAA